MTRRTRSAQLETKTARLRLAIRKKPYAVRVSPGVRLAYRRNETAGSWSVLAADGHGGNWLKQFAIADDFEDAHGSRVLDYWRAQDKARELARGTEDSERPITVGEALDCYALDLAGRDGEAGNVSRVSFHLPPALASKTVVLLTARELRHWRDGLLKKGLASATVKRTCKPLAAALNLAADTDPRITNRSAWKTGLKALPDGENARNVVLPEADVRKLVALAYEISHAFGLLVETAAVTGARVSQLRRLEVRDLLTGPRLTMPSSKKGKGLKKIDRRPVPIPPSLAANLQQNAAGRPGDAPLLLTAEGDAWTKNGHSALFRAIVINATLDPTEVTIYSLRHSVITRQLLAGVPVRIVASMCDTSTAMIEATYSRFIGDHSDALVRSALLDLAAPAGGDAVPIC